MQLPHHLSIPVSFNKDNHCYDPSRLDVLSRSSHRRCSVKKGVLKNFAIFTGKHLRKRLQHRCFPVNIAKYLRTPILMNISGGCFCLSK